MPAPSLIAGSDKSYVHHIHYKYHRELTHRECASIHGFPVNYDFAGRPIDVAKQVVNAVPVELATEIAQHIFKMIKKISKKNSSLVLKLVLS